MIRMGIASWWGNWSDDDDAPGLPAQLEAPCLEFSRLQTDTWFTPAILQEPHFRNKAQQVATNGHKSGFGNLSLPDYCG
jgi:hypothetical protein